MATTVLFIEHLITGLQAGLWMSLLFFSCPYLERVGFDRIKGFEAFATLLAISLLYPIGVFIDNFADHWLDELSKDIRDKQMQAKGIEDPDITAMRVLMEVKDEFLKSYMNYIRTRVRISRSSVINFALITIASIVFTISKLNGVSKFWLSLLICGELAFGTGMTYFAFWSWRKISETFTKQVARAYKTNLEINRAAKS